MSQQLPTPASTPTSAGASSPKQEQLINYCRGQGLSTPVWQVMSDRRGGRTAWSCSVNVNGHTVPARYWYDGQYVNNAREDAAERALQIMGQLPQPIGPQATHYQQQQQQQQKQKQKQQQQRAVYGSPGMFQGQ